MANTPTLMGVFSHKFTPVQVLPYFEMVLGKDAQFTILATDYGFIAVADNNEVLARIVYLSGVNNELQIAISNISANANLDEIKNLSKLVVAEAIKSNATHFMCAGQPTFAMWANLMAGGLSTFHSPVFLINLRELDGKMSSMSFYLKHVLQEILGLTLNFQNGRNHLKTQVFGLLMVM